VTRIYKILTRPEWLAACDAGVFTGSAVDVADGYIHFSTAAQAQETGRRYFAGRSGLVVVGFEAEALGESLKWEPSRGGDLFPHLYGTLPTALAVEAMPVDLDEAGVPVLAGLKA
jgi:uncharacterized protein (DUF952 family)